MNSSSQVQAIFLAASSPLFSYAPFLSGSPANDGSWSPANTSVDAADRAALSGSVGTPYRTAGRMNGSTVSLTGISATGFTPYFTPSSGSQPQTATIQVGSSPEAALPGSGSRVDLTTTTGSGTVSPFGPRDIKLKVGCTGVCDSSHAFTFGGALIDTLLVAPGSTAVNASLDDSADQINYTGFAAAGGARDVKIIPDQLVSQSRDRTLSFTATKDANATLMFTGTAIEILGPVGPTLSCYTFIVDNQITFKYNASAPVFVAQQTLGFVTGLAQQEHSLFLRNDVEGLGLALDAFKVWGQGVACFGSGCATGATPSSPPPDATPTQTVRTTVTPAANGPGYITGEGASAGSVIGGLIGALLALILLFALWRYWMVKRKPKEEKPKLDAFDEANSLPKQPNHFVSVKPKDEDGMGYMYPGRTAGTPFS